MNSTMRGSRVVHLFMLLVAAVIPMNIFAGGFREEVAEGNRALLAGEYDTAREAYDNAGVRHPESPYLYFNRALLAYRTGDLAAAQAGFEEAAVKTKELPLEALSHYNLGNVEVRKAERLLDGDLEEAIRLYESAVKHYQRALELDPTIDDAAVNTEIVRILLKDLLDKLSKQQEDSEGGKELEEIVRRLAELLESEGMLISQSKTAMGEETSSSTDLKELASAQGETKDASLQLASDMQALEAAGGGVPQGPSGAAQASPQSPLSTARGYLEDSVVDQAIAENHLENNAAGDAVPYQESAATLMEKALRELTQEQQQEQQGQQEQQEATQQESQGEEDGADEKAEDILSEEEENRRQRTLMQRGRYSPVDKDW